MKTSDSNSFCALAATSGFISSMGNMLWMGYMQRQDWPLTYPDKGLEGKARRRGPRRCRFCRQEAGCARKKMRASQTNQVRRSVLRVQRLRQHRGLIATLSKFVTYNGPEECAGYFGTLDFVQDHLCLVPRPI